MQENNSSRRLSIEEIGRLSGEAEDRLAALRRKESCVVMFIDLAGSTDFKDKNPDEAIWLPRLAFFLQTISWIVGGRGRVVKYIGDEVMAVFSGESAVLNAEHAAEEIISFCARQAKYEFAVKIGLDYGEVTLVDFFSSPDNYSNEMVIVGDPQGLVVDRCARITSRSVPGVVLCSESFYSASGSKQRWRKCGSFNAKGIRGSVRVYQLRYNNSPNCVIRDEPMKIAECMKRLKELEEIVRELKSLRD